MAQALRKLARRNRRKNITGNISVKLFGFRLFFSATANAERSKQLAAVSRQFVRSQNRINEMYALVLRYTARKATDIKLALPNLAIACGITIALASAIIAAIVYSGV